MAQDWAIKGDYVEACNCDVVCQCLWLEPPAGNACRVSVAWDIKDGEYGDVDLSGLSVCFLWSAEEGVMLAPETEFDTVLLIDDSATEEQQAALEDIFYGQAGGIFAPVADTHFKSSEVATVPVSFDRNGSEFSVTFGDAVTMEVTGETGFNDEIGTVAPHPFGPNFEMKTGKSSTATVAYNDTFTWDVSENNAFLCDFELANA